MLGLVVEGGSDVAILLSVSFSGPPGCAACLTAIANNLPSCMCDEGLVLDLAAEMESGVWVILSVSFSWPPDGLDVEAG